MKIVIWDSRTQHPEGREIADYVDSDPLLPGQKAPEHGQFINCVNTGDFRRKISRIAYLCLLFS